MTSCELPEGDLLLTEENQNRCSCRTNLEHAMKQETVLEGMAILCDEAHNLLVQVGPFTGRIPRIEGALGIAEGKTRDIAILSRVGKPVCFIVTGMDSADGTLLLSRRLAQERALHQLLEERQVGEVIPAAVTHLEAFGAFVDVGCGLTSMISSERLSVSRITHAGDRLTVGQHIFAAILGFDRSQDRVFLTHKELLGTWEENAALFRPGMTVQGTIRGVKDYGVFVELTPNLSGLAEGREGLHEGDRVSVYMKSILPDRMKIKLMLIDRLPPAEAPEPFHYFIQSGILTHWNYAPPGCRKAGGITEFCNLR